jgi:hypothetical protein
MKKLVPAAILALGLVTPAALPADEPNPTSTPSRETAARELFRTVGGLKMAEAGADAMVSVLRNNRELQPYEDVIRAWYRKTMAKSDFEAKIVALYAETFTEQELRELAGFYRSPLGQKALAKMPELTKRGAEIGAQAARNNQAELEQMMEARRREIESAGAKETEKPPAKPTAAPRTEPR